MALNTRVAAERVSRAVKTFSPQQLVIIAGLAVLGVVAAIALVRWVSQPSYAVLQAGLRPEQMNELTQALDAEGVAYKFSSGGATLMVPHDELQRARAAASSVSPAGKSKAAGYELLDKSDFTTSQFKRHVDYQRALEGELTNTINSLDEVADARVHLAMPEERLFADDKSVAQASVLVTPSRPISEQTVQSIVQLLAASVPGLTPDRISVAETGGRVLFAAGESGAALSGAAFDEARKQEALLAAKAETMLATVYGPGRAVVRVSADVDMNESQRESTSFDPDSQVAVKEEQTAEEFDGAGVAPQGVVGVTNTTIDPAQTSDQSKYNRNDKKSEYAVDKVVTAERELPGRIRRLSVAVAVDDSLNPAPDPARVQTLVAAAVGLDPTRGDTIAVDTATFDRSISTAAEKAAQSAKSQETKTKLVGYGRSGAAAAGLLLCVFVLWRGLRRKETVETLGADELAAAAEPFGIGPGGMNVAASSLPPAGALGAGGGDDDDEDEDEEDALAGSQLASVLAKPAALDPASEVLDLIDREPDEVATLLRSWVADRRS